MPPDFLKSLSGGQVIAYLLSDNMWLNDLLFHFCFVF